jgi:hypothetical protein
VVSGLRGVADYSQVFEMHSHTASHIRDCGLKPVTDDGAALRAAQGKGVKADLSSMSGSFPLQMDR